MITYQPPASSGGVTTLVTHRIIAIGRSPEGEQVLRTKGDANPDPPTRGCSRSPPTRSPW